MTSIIDLKLLHTTWEDVERLSEELSAMIIDSGFVPDVIVAVSRGGFDPARILCDQLDVTRLASLQVEYYRGVKDTNPAPRIVYPLNADVGGLRVLMVDDVSDSGVSLIAAKEHIEKGDPEELRIATLHIKPWTDFMPDYHAAETDAWIVYPWEPVESIRSIASKLEKEGLAGAEIRNELVRLGFQKKLLEKLS